MEKPDFSSTPKGESTEGHEHSLAEEIRQYYDLGLESDRLSNAEGQLEFVRTQEIINSILPSAPSIVIDTGGGPGAYACWLAREGHEVHLIDPVPLHLEQAKRASDLQPETPIASIQQGDARKLGLRDESADGVFCPEAACR